jgi:hypothetical protein
MPAFACCLLLAAFSSSVVEAAAGADGEVAVGRAPVDFAGPSRDAVTFTLTPGVGLHLRSGSSNFVFSYTPRVFFRLPNALGVDHPLVLHQVGLDHTVDVGKDITWASSANMSIGEIDYTAAGVVFDPALSSVVKTSITDILRSTVQTGFKWGISPHLKFNWDVGAEYTTTLDGNGSNPTAADTATAAAATSFYGSQVPASFQLRTKPDLSYAVDRDNHIAAGFDVTYQWFKETARYLLLSPELTWQTQLSRRTQLELSGGIAYVWTLQAVIPTVSKKNSLGGTGNIALTSEMYRSGATKLKTAFNADLEWYFDPILGTSQPRAGAKASGELTFGRKWLIGPNASFYTVLRKINILLQVPPGTVVDQQTQTDIAGEYQQLIAAPDQTVLRLELPIRYQLSRAAALTFGVRSAFRGRALPQPGFRLDEQVEYWAFVGLAVRFATSEDRGTWLPL